VQKVNHAHLKETAAAVREIGARSISFLAVDLKSTAFNRPQRWPGERQAELALTLDEIAVLENQIEALADNPLVADSELHLRRIVHYFRAHLGLEAPEAPRCNAPWVSAVMDIDGCVKPCFFHAPIGAGILDSALNSAPARRFREGLQVATNSTCRNCVCSLYLEHNRVGT
jgi:MoaA/NifB/PqqE/SkfB family radical SAM enzyme